MQVLWRECKDFLQAACNLPRSDRPALDTTKEGAETLRPPGSNRAENYKKPCLLRMGSVTLTLIAAADTRAAVAEV